ncbi:4Fe-4S dicluster domain-containing protein [Asticcacaulis solisilvae]|uniref:4Fe-4S dicluster domain-containing protein n=1 Tax=Asticcacaulis solisilvae TaxID=1217274 RepID=UPI003FD719AD
MARTDDACKQEPGVFAPVIDRARCEGKADCVVICPYDVFALGTLPPAERAGLSFLSKVKGTLHGWKQSFAVNADACRACGLCVEACPEKAIKLARR